MLALKWREYVKGCPKIAFVTVILGLMLFAEPVLAKKGGGGKSSRGSPKSRPAAKSSAGSKTRAAPAVRSRPAASNRASIKYAAPSRAAGSRTRLSTSKLRGPSRARGTVKRSVGQVKRVVSGYQRSKISSRRLGKSTSLGTTQRKKAASSKRKSSGRSFNIRRSVEVSSSVGKRKAVSSGSRVSSEKTSRIVRSIGEKRSVGGKVSRDGEPRVSTQTRTESRGRKVVRESESIVKRPERRAGAGRKSYETRKRVALMPGKRISLRSSSLFTRPAGEKSQYIRPSGEKSQHIRGVNERRQRIRIGDWKQRRLPRRKSIDRQRIRRRWKERSSRAVHRERSSVVRDINRHEHVYMDRHHRIHRRIVQPRFRFAVRYNWGPYWTFRYVWPYYHRRYVFVSLGGYWPIGYRYARYSWYGCHPYYWYGYYPIAREVTGDSYNYYTYNYDDDDGTAAVESYETTCGIDAVDHTTFADIRERLAQEAVEEPEEATLADRYFEDAVGAFEAGDYNTAADLFARAMELAPDDMILPFAYCQALFAGEKYLEAAEVLRAALAKVSPEKEGVFYPRGLYPEEDILFDQIDRLAEKAELYSFDSDLQLLLGYHLLGIGEVDEAVEPLRLANQDLENASSAAVLLSLVEKMRIQSAEDTGE